MTITSHDLAGLSHDKLLSTITRTLGVSSGFDKAEIDSYYTRAQGVRPVHIETYPKRRRSSGRADAMRAGAGMGGSGLSGSGLSGSGLGMAASAADVAGSTAGSRAAASLAAESVDAGPSYADFFAQPHAMTA